MRVSWKQPLHKCYAARSVGPDSEPGISWDDEDECVCEGDKACVNRLGKRSSIWMGYGHVDDGSAAMALGVCIPLSLIVTVSILVLGAWAAPSQPASRPGRPATPIWRFWHGSATGESHVMDAQNA